ELFALCCARSLDRIGQNHRRVVTQSCHCVWSLFVALAKFFNKGLYGWGRILRGVMSRIVGAFHGCPTDLEKLRRLPTVPSKNRHSDSKLARLERNQARFGVVGGDEYRVWISWFDGGELGVEIFVPPAELLLSDDRAPLSLEALSKILCQT